MEEDNLLIKMIGKNIILIWIMLLQRKIREDRPLKNSNKILNDLSIYFDINYSFNFAK